MPAIVSVDLIEIAVFGEFSLKERPKLPLRRQHARRRDWIVGHSVVILRPRGPRKIVPR